MAWSFSPAIYSFDAAPNRAEVAWRVYQRLLKIRPAESELLIGLASAYAAAGNNERLVESYRPIAKHYETPEKLLLEAVRAAFIMENTDAAISFLGQRRTLRVQPRDALILLAQGLLDAGNTHGSLRTADLRFPVFGECYTTSEPSRTNAPAIGMVLNSWSAG